MNSYAPYLTRTVVSANSKGGVGKTSVAVNVAGLAAESGWRTLLIDLDPQGNAADDLGYGVSDDGMHLADAIQGRAPMAPVITDVRPNLDVIPGGSRLDDLESFVTGAIMKGQVEEPHLMFAAALAGVAGEYDLIVIDTPPTRPLLMQQALGAARWLLIPTKSDRASIRGLQKLAQQLTSVRRYNPDMQVLGAVLFGVTSGASNVRKNAIEDLSAVLNEDGVVFDTVIRHVEATAVEARYANKLVHELAKEVEDAEPYYEAIKAGNKPVSLPSSAPRLAGDYMLLTQEILSALTEVFTDEAEAVEA